MDQVIKLIVFGIYEDSPSGLWLALGCLLAGIGCAVWALEADKASDGVLRNYTWRIVAAHTFIVCSIGTLWFCMFYGMRISPESPSLIQTAIEMGEARLYFSDMLKAENDKDFPYDHVKCAFGMKLDQIFFPSNPECRANDSCKRLLNGETLTRSEALVMLENLRAAMAEKIQNNEIREICKKINFTSLSDHR